MAQSLIWFSILLAVLALLGVPLYAVIGLGAIAAYIQQGLPAEALIIEIMRLGEIPTLAAIPLFTLAGYILAVSQAPQRMVKLVQWGMGKVPGGLAMIGLVFSALFTAFTGASGVTIVALGAVLYPALISSGFSQKFSLGLVTTSGSLGLLFAPSIPLILYAVVAQQSGSSEIGVDQLFIAGVAPGLFMLAVLMVYSFFVARKNQSAVKQQSPHQQHQKMTSSLNSVSITAADFWEVPLPIVVLGGIYSGLLALSEAAALTLIYVFVVEVFILREVNREKLIKTVKDASAMIGAILLVFAVSLASTNYVIDAEVPEQLFESIHGLMTGQISFMLVLLVFLLILGMFLDIFSAIVIMIPILLPIANGFGVHPVHLGIVFLATMQLGYMTPPVGMNLFIASHRFEKPVLEVYRASWPFLLLLLATVFVIALWPQLSLFALS
ncbi:MAG: TRAP transporter large permease [bacterium]